MPYEYFSDKLNQRFEFPDDTSPDEMRQFLDHQEGLTPPPAPHNFAETYIAQPLQGAAEAAPLLLGAPVGMLNLFNQAVHAFRPFEKTGPPTIPGGPETFLNAVQAGERALGIENAPQNEKERLLRGAGQAAGQGLITALLPESAVDSLPAALQWMYKSTGSLPRDIMVSLLGWLGGEAGAKVSEHMGPTAQKWLPVAGGVAATMAPAVGEWRLASELSKAGARPLTQEERQIQQRAPWMSAYSLTGNELAKKAEQGPVYSFAGGQEAHNAAGQQLAHGEQMVRDALAPVGDLPVGQEAKVGEAARDRLGDAVRLESAVQAEKVRNLHPFVRKNITPIEATDISKKGFDVKKDQFDADRKKVFNGLEAITGDDPVIMLKEYSDADADIVRQNAAANITNGPPKYHPSLNIDRDQLSMWAYNKPYAQLHPMSMQRFRVGQIENAITSGQGLVPFWVARRIESRLGQYAFQGGAQIGNLNQGQAKRLWAGIRNDMDESFKMKRFENYPNMGADLQAARDSYRDGIDLFNRSVVKHLFSRNPGQSAQFLSGLNNGQNLAFVMSHAPQDVQGAIRGYTLADWYKKATTFNTPNTFNPQRFLDVMEPFYTSGKMDVLFPQGTPARGRIDALRKEFTAAAAIPKADKVSQLAKEVEGTSPRFVYKDIINPRNPEHAAQFFGAAALDERQGVVQLWAKDFLDNAQKDIRYPQQGRSTLAMPSTMVRELKPLIRNGTVDVMFRDFPGVADELKGTVPVLEKLMRSESTVKKDSMGWMHPAALVQVATGAHMLWNLGRALATGSPYHAWLGAAEAAAELTPYYFTKWVHSETGKRVLAEGITRKYGPAATGFAARVMGREEAKSREDQWQQFHRALGL